MAEWERRTLNSLVSSLPSRFTMTADVPDNPSETGNAEATVGMLLLGLLRPGHSAHIERAHVHEVFFVAPLVAAEDIEHIATSERQVVGALGWHVAIRDPQVLPPGAPLEVEAAVLNRSYMTSIVSLECFDMGSLVSPPKTTMFLPIRVAVWPDL